jgi:hypothetical protein
MPSKPRGARPGGAPPPPPPSSPVPPPTRDSLPPAPASSPQPQPEAQPPGTGRGWAVVGVLALIALVTLVATMSTSQQRPPVTYVYITATSALATTSVPTLTAPPPSATPVPIEAFVAPDLGRANLRSGPGKDHLSLSRLRVERVVILGAADGPWLFVDAPSEGCKDGCPSGFSRPQRTLPACQFLSLPRRPSALHRREHQCQLVDRQAPPPGRQLGGPQRHVPEPRCRRSTLRFESRTTLQYPLPFNSRVL